MPENPEPVPLSISLIFLAVLGPGFITAKVDNDSGGIYTYSQAGAKSATCRCGR